MDSLYQFYEKSLGATGFYQCLKKRVTHEQALHNQLLILPDEEYPDQGSEPPGQVERDTLRLDMPVMMGSQESSERVLILGLEPRHTNDFYNILKRGNLVYGTPFGIDRWYSSAKQNIYPKAFHPYLSADRLFLFSDFVKEYLVIDPKSKVENSELARSRFESLFKSKYRDILEREIAIFRQDIIIGLGKIDIGKKIPIDFIRDYRIKVVSHPIQGNYPKMKKSLNEIFGLI